MKPLLSPLRGSRGFALLEILVGACVLALAVMSLAAYTGTQRKGLIKSSRLADGTQVAATALETMRGKLADSAAFSDLFKQVGSGEKVIAEASKVNNIEYTVRITVTQAPDPFYALKLRAQVKWLSSHQLELGLLVPGASVNL